MNLWCLVAVLYQEVHKDMQFICLWNSFGMDCDTVVMSKVKFTSVLQI